MQQEDTIAAVATPPGVGGVGIVRLSGDEALVIADRMFRARNGKRLTEAAPFSALYGEITDAEGRTIDEALALVMKAPRSYTREDVAELQCHGGSLVLRTVLERALALGARLAERGEFTKRAFLNGRIDLSEAQAVMEIVGAKTEASLRMASGRLSGRFSEKIGGFRDELLSMIAHLEAAIDFPEDDVDELSVGEVRPRIEALRTGIDALLKTARAGRILRDGLRTAILGKPNVGKSSLLNALLREDRAIVTDIPGTTRDSIEEYADLGGVPLCVIDTAGIREAEDTVERIGVERARQAAEGAALVLAVFDGSAPPSAEDREILSLTRGKDTLFLLNKSDMPSSTGWDTFFGAAVPDEDILRISAKTGDGTEALTRAVTRKAFGRDASFDETQLAADARETDVLRRTAASLSSAICTIDDGMSADFVVIDLRDAWETLGEITGDTVSEEIIDEIFRRFCLGK